MSTRLSTTVLLAVALTIAVGGARSAHRHLSEFIWIEHGQALSLRSENAGGVVVTRAEPAPFHGLQRGDVILSLDGSPVRDVGEVTGALGARTAPVSLRIRRAGVDTTLVWSRADYAMFAAPAPEAPPTPPVPHN